MEDIKVTEGTILESLNNKADIDGGNFKGSGLEQVIDKYLEENTGSGLPVGTIFSHTCSSTFVPENSLPCDGAEYSNTQFNDLWNNYLVANLLNTCTYAEYEQELSAYGQCAKFAINETTGYFRVPKIKDKVLTDIADTVDVKGNGLGLGLTNGTQNGTMVSSSVYEASGLAQTAVYGKAVGTAYDATKGGGFSTTEVVMGVTTDASKSGIIADTTNAKTYLTLRHFVVVATGTINQSAMDWSNWASSLQGKLNADHSNDTKPYVTESYVNGTSWYRVWSDGWIEQGGVAESNGQHVNTSVSLLKGFANTNYNIVVTQRTESAMGSYINSCSACPNTTKAFYIRTGHGEKMDYNWYACGY